MRSLRLATAGVVAAWLLALGLSPGLAQAKSQFGGVIRDAGGRVSARDVVGGRVVRARRAMVANPGGVPYGGGPVLQWNRTHVIFWQPAGSGLSFDPGYERLIETFLRNVAAASHSQNNVYGLTGQYTDSRGPAVYASIYGGGVVARDPLPANGCTEPAAPPSGTGPGWRVCLTDEQLQREIERVVRRNRLRDGPNDIYFLVTPTGLGDCQLSGPDNCSLGGDANNGYCGYHSQTDDGRVLYAVIPYNAVSGHCQSNHPRPNRSAADPAISTISHEQSEMVTDPLDSAWVDPYNGEAEIGDLCLTSFGPSIGGSGPGAWNEVINRGHYYLQEEWSNHDRACEPRARPDSAWFQFGIGPNRSSWVWFSARGTAAQGRIVSYRWFFGAGRTASGGVAWHRYRRPGRYRVVLRATDSWGNWAFSAVTFTLARVKGGAVVVTKSG